MRRPSIFGILPLRRDLFTRHDAFIFGMLGVLVAGLVLAARGAPETIAGPAISLSPRILPIYAGLERLPASLLDAAGDLGAKPLRTFRSVIMPLLLPSIAAGSIFTFSLTLGDYIIPQIIGNSSYFLGQAVYSLQGTAGNIPLAAAFTVVFGFFAVVGKRHVATQSRQLYRHRCAQRNTFVGGAKNHVELNAAVDQTFSVILGQFAQLRTIVKQTGVEKIRAFST